MPLRDQPYVIAQLWPDQGFRAQSRMYNSIFAFSSLGAKVLDDLPGHGPYSFRVQGGVQHRLGPIIPDNDNVASAE